VEATDPPIEVATTTVLTCKELISATGMLGIVIVCCGIAWFTVSKFQDL